MSEENKKWWQSLLESNLWKLSFLIPIGVAVFLFWINKPFIKFEILSNTEVLTVKEYVSNLKIIHNDSVLNEIGKNISIMIVRIENNGYKGVQENYYDSNFPLGFEVTKGELINVPEIIGSSDTSYFNSTIFNTNKNIVTLRKLIFNSGDYFTMKLKILNNNGIPPYIKTLGKISNITHINLIDKSNEHNQPISQFNFTPLIILAGILIVTILAMEIFNLLIKREKILYGKDSIKRLEIYITHLERTIEDLTRTIKDNKRL